MECLTGRGRGSIIGGRRRERLYGRGGASCTKKLRRIIRPPGVPPPTLPSITLDLPVFVPPSKVTPSPSFLLITLLSLSSLSLSLYSYTRQRERNTFFPLSLSLSLYDGTLGDGMGRVFYGSGGGDGVGPLPSPTRVGAETEVGRDVRTTTRLPSSTIPLLLSSANLDPTTILPPILLPPFFNSPTLCTTTTTTTTTTTATAAPH